MGRLDAIQAERRSQLRDKLTVLGDWCTHGPAPSLSRGLFDFWLSLTLDPNTSFPEARSRMRNSQGLVSTLTNYSVIRYPYLSTTQVLRREALPISQLAPVVVMARGPHSHEDESPTKLAETASTKSPGSSMPMLETELWPLLNQMNVSREAEELFLSASEGTVSIVGRLTHCLTPHLNLIDSIAPLILVILGLSGGFSTC